MFSSVLGFSGVGAATAVLTILGGARGGGRIRQTELGQATGSQQVSTSRANTGPGSEYEAYGISI